MAADPGPAAPAETSTRTLEVQVLVQPGLGFFLGLGWAGQLFF